MNSRPKSLPLRQKDSIEQVAATISKESLESISEILTETVYDKVTELLQQEIVKSLSQIEDYIEDMVETKMQELLLSMLNGIKNGKEQFQEEHFLKRKKGTGADTNKKSRSNRSLADSDATDENKTKIINTLMKHQELTCKELMELAEVKIKKPSQFMNQLMKSYPSIQKSGRSKYRYQADGQGE